MVATLADAHQQFTTWRDVDRVRTANPDWTYPQIAAALGCGAAYVRATFARKGWTPKPSFQRKSSRGLAVDAAFGIAPYA
jgi:hypothetical protein